MFRKDFTVDNFGVKTGQSHVFKVNGKQLQMIFAFSPKGIKNYNSSFDSKLKPHLRLKQNRRIKLDRNWIEEFRTQKKTAAEQEEVEEWKRTTPKEVEEHLDSLASDEEVLTDEIEYLRSIGVKIPAKYRKIS